ncbi:MAG: alpha/beta fold hydrolase [Gemmatimonadales bacterium]
MSVSGLKMFYEVHGSGRPILLLHGATATIDYCFAKLIPELAKHHTVIAPEQQAHGHTKDDPDRPLTYERMAQDTAALLDHLNVGPVDVIGWSDGGNVGVLLAIHHPELVRKLVVTGANCRTDAVDPETLQWLGSVRAEEWPKEILDAQQQVGVDVQQFAASLPRFKRMWLNFNVPTEDLRHIQAPVLVMGGDRDMIRLEHFLETFRALPHAQLAILPGTGHATLKERPEWFLDIVAAFLAEPMRAENR